MLWSYNHLPSLVALGKQLSRWVARLARLSQATRKPAAWYLLYRGQRAATQRILSPLGRQNAALATALVEQMRSAGLGDGDIAGYVMRWHDHPIPPVAAPPGLDGKRLGGVGVTATEFLGMASYFAAGGPIYRLRVPASLVLLPSGWPGFFMEQACVILHEVPTDAFHLQKTLKDLPMLKVNERDLLVLS